MCWESHLSFTESISSTHSLIFHFRVPALLKKLQTVLCLRAITIRQVVDIRWPKD